MLVGGTSLQLRSSFLASPGCLFISADYEQIEFRVLAHLSGDPHLIRGG
jgi:DNA polymerase-1